MRLFSLLYIAASHTVHVHYFSCVLLIVSCHIRMSVCVYVWGGGGGRGGCYYVIFDNCSQLTLKMS